MKYTQNNEHDQCLDCASWEDCANHVWDLDEFITDCESYRPINADKAIAKAEGK
jgi:hypothetical protein